MEVRRRAESHICRHGNCSVAQAAIITTRDWGTEATNIDLAQSRELGSPWSGGLQVGVLVFRWLASCSVLNGGKRREEGAVSGVCIRH